MIKGSGVITGTDEAEIIKGGKGDDTITGGKGNDTITGGTGRNTIIYNKGDGDDVIYARYEDNLIYVGKGNDSIKTSLAANNTYVFNNGDGSCIIDVKYSTPATEAGRIGYDTIKLTGVDKSGFRIKVVNDSDVHILYNNNGEKLEYKDCIIIKNYLDDKADLKKIEILTNDGEITSLNELLYLNITDGNFTKGRIMESTDDFDNLLGSFANDKIISNGAKSFIYGGAGNDIIYSTGDNSTIHGGEGNDTIYVGDGDYLLYGEAGDDFIIAGRGNDTIYGGDGDDNITAGKSGTKLIVGGRGDDIINLNASATNILKFNNGDGNDMVQVTADGTGNVATIKLNDTAKDGFSQKVSGNDLIISYNKNSSGMYEDTITYKDFFKNLEDIPEIKIKTNDGYETTAKIDELKEAIAGWLSSTGYSDIATGMASATEEQINELNCIFAVNQEQILPY